MFADQYIGGAELTSEAIISDSLLPMVKINSSRLSTRIMEANKDKFWIFGNFSGVAEHCLVYAAKNLNYSVLEYDYKYCNFRSPEKHIAASGDCSCESDRRGKLVSVFFKRAKTVWMMSEGQQRLYLSKLPFLDNTRVLSSVFSKDSLELMNSLDTSSKNNKWVIFDSKSWVKGTSQSIAAAKERGLDYELVKGLSYEAFLTKLANSKGLVYMPPGSDTCPRMVIEAKILGCELLINDNVQHKDEEWFKSPDSIKEYLNDRTNVFWTAFEEAAELNLPKQPPIENHNFNIIVPFYNAGPWIGKCINSIKRQTHTKFRCYLVDDMSTDNTVELIRKEIVDDNRFELLVNKTKCYALKNIVNTIVDNDFDDEDVNILLDGDDWLSSINVLSYLDSKYSEDKCLMTYGNYVYYPSGKFGVEPSQYPDSVVKSNGFRGDMWRASHLRTFKTMVFNHLDLNDLKNDSGDYYKTAYDQALMLPLLEISGENSLYIDKTLHVYNRDNPLNVDKTKAKLQSETARKIRQMSKYEKKFDKRNK